MNVHKFLKHEWKIKVPKSWRNLGTWRYVMTFKYCYPNIPDILTKQYGLKWGEKIIVYVTKEITTPKFRRYRTRFRKMFHGKLEDYRDYLREFMKRQKIKAYGQELTSTRPSDIVNIKYGRKGGLNHAKKRFSNKKVETVKEGPGVYKLFNMRGSLTYVGKAKNLKERLQEHLNEGDIRNIRQFEAKHTETTREAERLEKNIIRWSKPVHNIKEE